MAERGAYCATVKKTLAFELTTSHVAAGLSSRQARHVLLSTKDKTGLQKLFGVRQDDVAKFVRIVVAVNLQRLADKIRSIKCWAVSIAFDGATTQGKSFIDELASTSLPRLRMCTY
jgi:hypothetical protein